MHLNILPLLNLLLSIKHKKIKEKNEIKVIDGIKWKADKLSITTK